MSQIAESAYQLMIKKGPFEKKLKDYLLDILLQDNRTNIRPCFETYAYYNLHAERSEENEELSGSTTVGDFNLHKKVR